MKRLILISTILISSFISVSQERTPEEILEDQINAFNNRDIEHLLSNIEEGFKWFYVSKDTMLLEVAGKKHFEQSMIKYFENIKKVQAEIIDFTVFKSRITFHEQVRYTNAKGEEKVTAAMGIYEIRNGLIHRVWYFIE